MGVGLWGLSGRGGAVVPGGRPGVGLKEGALLVKSSQGGGTKDAWMLEK